MFYKPSINAAVSTCCNASLLPSTCMEKMKQQIGCSKASQAQPVFKVCTIRFIGSYLIRCEGHIYLHRQNTSILHRLQAAVQDTLQKQAVKGGAEASSLKANCLECRKGRPKVGLKHASHAMISTEGS